MNKLYYGDNLSIMRDMMKSNSVDLIYLDPPFNSNKNYNLVYKEMTGQPISEQVDAFCDTWTLDPVKEQVAKTMPVLLREHGVDDAYVRFWQIWMNALRKTQPQLLAYLVYMVERLLYMKTVLRPTGTLYLHCDPTASHYIKVMMDGIFGHQNFRNEISWRRSNPKSLGKTNFPNCRDIILRYSKGHTVVFNKPYGIHDEEYVKKAYKYTDDSGRPYRLLPLLNPNDDRPNLTYEFLGVKRVWRWTRDRMEKAYEEGLVVQLKPGAVPQYKKYLEDSKGRTITNDWDDVKPVHGKESLGYATQKPIALLDRIIQVSSNPGDVVFDPFCGCGTTIYSAVKNGRQWIGCDIAMLSVRLITRILTGEKYRLVEGIHFEVDGIPVSVDQAGVLFKRDAFQFQHWFVERVGGFPTHRKTADRGVDGRLYFETRDGLKEMVISVKGGAIRPTDIRDLRGVLEREEDAEMAAFLSLREPTPAMRREAAEAGMYEYQGVQYPRVQLLTAREVLEEKKELATPSKIGVKAHTTKQGSLPLA